jgi:hypothetical protein
MALTFTSLRRLCSQYQTDVQEILKTVFSNGFLKIICEQLLAGSRSLEARLTFVLNHIEKIAPASNLSEVSATGSRKRTWSANNREEGERSQDRRGSGSGVGGSGGQRPYDSRNSGNTSCGRSGPGSGYNKASIRSTAWKSGGKSGGGGGYGGGYGGYEKAGKRGRGGSKGGGGGGFGGHAGRGGYRHAVLTRLLPPHQNYRFIPIFLSIL